MLFRCDSLLYLRWLWWCRAEADLSRLRDLAYGSPDSTTHLYCGSGDGHIYHYRIVAGAAEARSKLEVGGSPMWFSVHGRFLYTVCASMHNADSVPDGLIKEFKPNLKRH